MFKANTLYKMKTLVSLYLQMGRLYSYIPFLILYRKSLTSLVVNLWPT